MTPKDFAVTDSIIPIEDNWSEQHTQIAVVKDNTARKAKSTYDELIHKREEEALIKDPWEE